MAQNYIYLLKTSDSQLVGQASYSFSTTLRADEGNITSVSYASMSSADGIQMSNAGTSFTFTLSGSPSAGTYTGTATIRAIVDESGIQTEYSLSQTITFTISKASQSWYINVTEPIIVPADGSIVSVPVVGTLYGTVTASAQSGDVSVSYANNVLSIRAEIRTSGSDVVTLTADGGSYYNPKSESKTVSIQSTRPSAYIFNGSNWIPATPYIWDGTHWVITQINIT